MSVEKIVEEFKGKLHKYDKDDGFIVYVEDYDNRDFDVALIVDYFEESLTQAKEEGRKEERERIVKEIEKDLKNRLPANQKKWSRYTQGFNGGARTVIDIINNLNK